VADAETSGSTRLWDGVVPTTMPCWDGW
jgi:hypothetical protein